MRSIAQSIGQVEVSSLPGLLARPIARGFVVGRKKPKTLGKRNVCFCPGRMGHANHVLGGQLIVAVMRDKKLIPIPPRGRLPLYGHDSLPAFSSAVPPGHVSRQHSNLPGIRMTGPVFYSKSMASS